MEYLKKIKRNKNLLFIVIGSFIMILGSCILIYNYNLNKKMDEIEDKSIDVFFEEPISEDVDSIIEHPKEEKNEVIIDYKAILEIPKINLKKGIVDKNSLANNVNRNIYVLKETSFPDEQVNSHIILAAHSGNSYISFFKNLNKLDLEDQVYFYYEQMKYIYKISKKYEIDKTGTMALRLTDKSDITLISCINGTKKQIVFVGELIEKINY